MQPCSWPVTYDGCGSVEGGTASGCAALDALDDAEKARVEDMATSLLWEWTDRIFGLCGVRIRPCRSECAGASEWSSYGGPLRSPLALASHASGGRTWTPVLVGGKWMNVSCGSCLGAECLCDEEGPTSLRIPGPATLINGVTVGGVVLPSDAYVLEKKSLLRRVDGGTWPACQDLTKPDNHPSAFLIEYERGIPVPSGGQVAAGVLACELAKALCNDKSCNLPQRVQTVTRQGVTVGAVVDLFEDVREGRTGIWLIDSWVASITRPRPQFASVRSPDYKPRGSSWRP